MPPQYGYPRRGHHTSCIVGAAFGSGSACRNGLYRIRVEARRSDGSQGLEHLDQIDLRIAGLQIDRDIALARSLVPKNLSTDQQ